MTTVAAPSEPTKPAPPAVREAEPPAPPRRPEPHRTGLDLLEHAWSRRELMARIAWLKRFRGLVSARADDLCELMEDELGKPRWEGLVTDVLPLLEAARWHQKNARRVLKPHRVRGGGIGFLPMRCTSRRDPVGTVAIIATWNYPVQLLGVQLIQALVAGNRVIVKPSEHAPRTQGLLLDLAQEAGLPDGTLSRTGATRQAGEDLVRRAAEDGFAQRVVFTGSTGVGRRIAQTLAGALVPSTLELSGRDSAFVLEDADARLAARTLWYATTLNAGQTCMAPRRVLVQRRVYDDFCREMGACAAGARPRRLVSEAAATEAFAAAAAAVDRGARSLSGVMEAPGGAWLRPLAIADVALHDPLLKGTHFGPIVAIAPYDRFEDALAAHHACDQHLSTSVFTANAYSVKKTLSRRLGVSRITINDCVVPSAHPGSPIAGRGASGWGASQGEAGLLDMTVPVELSVTPRWPRFPIDPPSPEDAARFRKVLRRLHRPAQR